MPLVREWAAAAIRSVDVLPPSTARRDALERAQVSTRSPMGSVIYETGGLLPNLSIRNLPFASDRNAPPGAAG